MPTVEVSLLFDHVLVRLNKLEADMIALQVQEKDLRTVVVDGFQRMDARFVQIDARFEQMDKKFDDRYDAHEGQIDFLAIELKNTKESLEKRMDKMDGKLDRILDALAIS